MKIRFLLFALLLCTGFANGQNTGYGGKRVVLKAELLHGTKSPFSGAAAELVLGRSGTIVVGVRQFSGQYLQRYMGDDYITSFSNCPESNPGDVLDMADKATVSTRAVYGECGST